MMWVPKKIMNREIMMETIVPHLKRHLNKASAIKPLVVLDAAHSHTLPAVVKAFHANLMITAIVPAGTMSWCQWVDTHFAA